MADKKNSLIKDIRSGKKTPFLKKINPFHWPSIVIGHSLKTFDNYINFKKSIVKDIGDGKDLPWYIYLYIAFHPLILLNGYHLRAKTSVRKLKEKIIPSSSKQDAKRSKRSFIPKIPHPKLPNLVKKDSKSKSKDAR